MYNIRFVLMDKNAVEPSKAHKNDAGFDIYSPIDALIYPKHFVVIDTGIGIDVEITNKSFENNYLLYFQIKGRSGLSMKKHIELCNAGVIDQDYKGSIVVKLYNMGKKSYKIKKGDRIAQGIFYIIPRIEIGNVLNNKRNENGIGSTGK